jgi:hypothetical protein
MKKFLLFVYIVCWSSSGMGQIVLDQNDLPQNGDSQLDVVLSEMQSSTVSPGGSGSNQTWDFSFLIDNWQHAEGDYLNPSNTPNGSFFPTATLACVHDETTHEYFISDNNGMRNLGYDIDGEILTFDQSSYKIPLITYGNSIEHSSSYRYNILSANTYDVIHIDFISTADAWGTITTPAGTVNALRIYTTETYYDSSYVNGVGIQNSMIPGSYYYEWFTKNLGWPVLTIKYNTYIDDSDFKYVSYSSDLSGASTVTDLSQKKQIQIFPNPANDKITLNLSNINESDITLTIFNIMGIKVLSESISQNREVVNLNGICPGIYTIQIKSNNFEEKQILIVQ